MPYAYVFRIFLKAKFGCLLKHKILENTVLQPHRGAPSVAIQIHGGNQVRSTGPTQSIWFGATHLHKPNSIVFYRRDAAVRLGFHRIYDLLPIGGIFVCCRFATEYFRLFAKTSDL